jgi:hypothetical protein
VFLVILGFLLPRRLPVGARAAALPDGIAQ